MKKLLVLIPYTLTLIFGFAIFLLSANLTNNNTKELLIGISVTFLSIPCLYFVYDLTKSLVNKKLKLEIFDYAKMQVDRGILSVINQLQKLIFPYERIDFSSKGINIFLSLNKKSIAAHIKSTQYIGFQIFKQWGMNQQEFHDVLKNPFILKHLENNQTIAIIKLIKAIISIENIYKRTEVFSQTSAEKNEKYKIVFGKELSAENTSYPNRYLLLHHVKNDKFIVRDFGDFYKDEVIKLTNTFKVREEFIEPLSNSIIHVLKIINDWLTLTGDEFVIDSKAFKTSSFYN